MKTAPQKIDTADWHNLRARLQRSAQAYDDAHRHSPERIRAILEERARAAARVPAAPPAADEVLSVVRFTLGDERYAIETASVREILHLPAVAALPGTPDFLLGVANLRGQILAIFDVRRFFGIPGQDNTLRSRVIVLGTEHVEFGLLADTVDEVTFVRIDAIRETPASLPAGARAYLRGVTADALLVIDGAILLNDPRFTIDVGDNGLAEPP